jgi:hypothetical protein
LAAVCHTLPKQFSLVMMHCPKQRHPVLHPSAIFNLGCSPPPPHTQTNTSVTPAPPPPALTCRASRMCSRVCGMGPSVADTTRMAPSICRATSSSSSSSTSVHLQAHDFSITDPAWFTALCTAQHCAHGADQQHTGLQGALR